MNEMMKKNVPLSNPVGLTVRYTRPQDLYDFLVLTRVIPK
jgi:hypothetical protein